MRLGASVGHGHNDYFHLLLHGKAAPQGRELDVHFRRGELLRLLVAEQIYRALTLARGVPYHK